MEIMYKAEEYPTPHIKIVSERNTKSSDSLMAYDDKLYRIKVDWNTMQ